MVVKSMPNGNKCRELIGENIDKMKSFLIMSRNFVFHLKICCTFFVFPGLGFGDDDSFMPISKDKYQFGTIIKDGFYYIAPEVSFRGKEVRFGNWMPKMAEYWGQEDDVRRAVVPSAMLSWDGNLYTISLCDFGINGPGFHLEKLSYSESENEVKTSSVDYYPWKYAYLSDSSGTLGLGEEPYFKKEKRDETYFKWGAHNIFHPCIVQEVNPGQSGKGSEYLRIFHYIPTYRIINESKTPLALSSSDSSSGSYGPTSGSFSESLVNKVKGKSGKASASDGGTGVAIEFEDNEGAMWMEISKDDLSLNKIEFDKGDANNYLSWKYVSKRWYGRGCSPYVYPNHQGNFQCFHLEEEPYCTWLFHLFSKNESDDDDEPHGLHCNRYSRYRDSDFALSESKEIITRSSRSCCETGSSILPRFLKVGNCVYSVVTSGGYEMSLFEISHIQSNQKTITVSGQAVYSTVGAGLESIGGNLSYAPYDFDFCILNLDGTPGTPDSDAEEEEKILCVFCLTGGGSFLTPSKCNWDNRYLSNNWKYNHVVGVLGSIPFDGKYIVTWPSYYYDYSQQYIYAQNTIYVTDKQRGESVCVGVDDKSKEDEYRLYLNSHRIVPYTSSSGKHYMIYAYCYPGKVKRLYLGYAQYVVDYNKTIRLLPKVEFKKPGDSAWGESFGAFNDCSRIISMDLKNGHLWITFVGNNESEYCYFHIRVSDMIQE